ncbi:cytochrome P450 [Xylaria bambusicola]|uniref:cytochrome P450 n=1 Tax=Xylaria bambusicola TaxID=326684 RepID=UPI0020072DF7|nr:cytochrome P450 [Xylaria bambusicola]KAI0509330.1 cytochrome P450 [Xylaria bambusicola]
MEEASSMLAAYLVAGFATYIALLFSYRLFLHPLRGYPGPLLAKVSDVYGGIQAGFMSLHVKTRDDLLKYGPVMRYGPNKLVFSSIKALSDIYQNERVAKSHLYKHTAATDGVWHVFNVIDKASHRFKRKLIGQIVSERSMRIFEPIMLQQIDVFIHILQSSAQSRSPVNMTEKLKRLGIDTVSLLAFGYPLNTQVDPKYRFLIDAHIFGNYRANLSMQFPLFKKIRIYSFLELLFAKEVRQYFTVIENMITSRVAEEKDVRHDLYSIVADSMNPDGGQYLKDSEIWAEAVFFFPAGGETTSTLLAAAFFYLARNPLAYESLAKEIRSSFKDGREIKGGPVLASCKYLRACLDETMRISPPAPGTLWRELSSTETSTEPWIVDGHIIPPGVQVGVNTYATHHNEEIFSDSFEFKPERWNDPDIPQEQKELMNAAFQPFSIGTRSCAGKAMAYLQSSIVLARSIWYFDFQTAPGDLGKVGGGSPSLGKGRHRESEYQLYEIIAANHDGPNLIFQTRNDVIGELST